MPKGVEHWNAGVDLIQGLIVQRPLMPKGVEHTTNETNETTARSAETSDAERR